MKQERVAELRKVAEYRFLTREEVIELLDGAERLAQWHKSDLQQLNRARQFLVEIVRAIDEMESVASVTDGPKGDE